MVTGSSIPMIPRMEIDCQGFTVVMAAKSDFITIAVDDFLEQWQMEELGLILTLPKSGGGTRWSTSRKLHYRMVGIGSMMP